MSASVDRYRVRPGQRFRLADCDPEDNSTFDGEREAAEAEFAALNDRLEALQELLHAEGRHRVLVVLQAMDTGGKDGVIRKVFEGVNPTGVRVASFKVPTAPEMARDYLWRAHQQVPANGELVIFNRSHYEDLLVVRVHELAPEKRWRRRFDHIQAWEQMLADEGTTIVKFFLHISKDEQRQRLQDRLDDPEKRWKFSLGDLKEREHWNDYQAAYEEVIDRTSTDSAPWYVIPANRKWYRDLVICRILVATLESLDMTFPQPADLTGVVVT
ncbi:MAG TPA: polyphosphate kinase 2 family protein [Anaerolineae bacterium]|nr:polyphosphate kinase 2 family protein [Anaerolineae bacterium]